MERRLFARGFGAKEALSILRMVPGDYQPYKDEMVARSVHFYDKYIREQSNVRYLGLLPQVHSSVFSTLEPGFEPRLDTYACLCEYERDAVRLADICCRVRRCVEMAPPALFANGLADNMRGGYPEWNRAREAWDKARLDTFSRALSDTYMTLGRKSPALLGTFLKSLDDATYKMLYHGVQHRENASEASLKRSNIFLIKHYPGSDKLLSQVELSLDEEARSFFYDPSYRNDSVYKICYARAFNRGHVDWSHISRRLAARERYADSELDGFIARHDFMYRMDKLPTRVGEFICIYYEDYAKSVIKNDLLKSDKFSMQARSDALIPNENRGVSLITLFHGCSDDIKALNSQLPVVMKFCNQMYAQSSEIVSGIVDKFQDNSIDAGIIKRCSDAQKSYVMSNTCVIFDELSRQDSEIAGMFIAGLSDDLYAHMCERRAQIAELFPREKDSLNSNPVKPKAQAEIMDEDGLAANRMLDNTRTQQLLSAKSYRELLSQCLFRYEYEAYGNYNELCRHLFDSLSGKAPNETFLHIASNCQNIDDARMLARIVNITCESRNAVNLGESFDSLLCDDLQKVLCEPGVFLSSELRDAFSAGLSKEVVDGFKLREFTNVKSLGENPVVYSEDDVLFARSQGFTSGRWFSTNSLRQSVTNASNTAKKVLTDSAQDYRDMFSDIGQLSAVCCVKYIQDMDKVRGIEDFESEKLRYFGLDDIMSLSVNSDDMRSVARVCNLCLDAVTSGSDIGLFAGLNQDQRDCIQFQMENDIKSAYGKLPDKQKAKFLSSLNPTVREGVLAGMPGCWSNGVLLHDVPAELAPPTRYANRLNAFNCPAFDKPVERVKQPVFVEYSSNLERANEIRDLIRQASKDDDNWSLDAQYKLSVSCLATYQTYGKHAEAEAAGKLYSPDLSEPTYSFYELAEQCNRVGRSDAIGNIKVLSKVYRGVVDSIPDDGSAYSEGMRYAVKLDMARSLKLLSVGQMKEDFLYLCDDSHYSSILSEALEDMPVYVNSDASKFVGRARPKGLKDIGDTMSTIECIRTGLFNAGQMRKLSEVEAVLTEHDIPFEPMIELKSDLKSESNRDLDDLNQAAESISAGSSDGHSRKYSDGDEGDGPK